MRTVKVQAGQPVKWKQTEMPVKNKVCVRPAPVIISALLLLSSGDSYGFCLSPSGGLGQLGVGLAKLLR